MAQVRRRAHEPELKTAERLKVIAQVRATQPNCWLCGNWIDLGLDKMRHPLGSTVDEVIPRSAGGSATDPANVRHAHRCCNAAKKDGPVTDELVKRCRELYADNALVNRTNEVKTSRVWLS